jgi:hypothetical protein
MPAAIGRRVPQRVWMRPTISDIAMNGIDSARKTRPVWSGVNSRMSWRYSVTKKVQTPKP